MPQPRYMSEVEQIHSVSTDVQHPIVMCKIILDVPTTTMSRTRISNSNTKQDQKNNFDTLNKKSIFLSSLKSSILRILKKIPESARTLTKQIYCFRHFQLSTYNYINVKITEICSQKGGGHVRVTANVYKNAFQ